MKTSFLLLLITLASSSFASEAQDRDQALDARNRVITALSLATQSERCKQTVRTVLQEIENQDREISQTIERGRPEQYFWQHAKYAYESSYNHIKFGNCTLGNQ